MRCESCDLPIYDEYTNYENRELRPDLEEGIYLCLDCDLIASGIEGYEVLSDEWLDEVRYYA